MTNLNRIETARGMCYAGMGYFDLAARTISACARSARSNKERNEIIALASGYPAVVQHKEFIL